MYLKIRTNNTWRASGMFVRSECYFTNSIRVLMRMNCLGCRAYATNKELYEHVQAVHVPTGKIQNGDIRRICRWEGCDMSRKFRYGSQFLDHVSCESVAKALNAVSERANLRSTSRVQAFSL